MANTIRTWFGISCSTHGILGGDTLDTVTAIIKSEEMDGNFPFDCRARILASSCSKITLGFSISSADGTITRGIFCIGAAVSHIQVGSGGIFIFIFPLRRSDFTFDRPPFAKYYTKLSDSDTPITIISRRDYKRAVYFQCDLFLLVCLLRSVELIHCVTKIGGYQPAKTCLICPCPAPSPRRHPSHLPFIPPPQFNCYQRRPLSLLQTQLSFETFLHHLLPFFYLELPFPRLRVLSGTCELGIERTRDRHAQITAQTVAPIRLR